MSAGVTIGFRWRKKGRRSCRDGRSIRSGLRSPRQRPRKWWTSGATGPSTKSLTSRMPGFVPAGFGNMTWGRSGWKDQRQNGRLGATLVGLTNSGLACMISRSGWRKSCHHSKSSQILLGRSFCCLRGFVCVFGEWIWWVVLSSWRLSSCIDIVINRLKHIDICKIRRWYTTYIRDALVNSFVVRVLIESSVLVLLLRSFNLSTTAATRLITISYLGVRPQSSDETSL